MLLPMLQTQTRLAQECSDPDERAEELARQYHQDTQAAVAWARLLADGDSMVAASHKCVNTLYDV